MSRITDIKAKINVLEGGAFQELCDALLARKGYEGIHAYGMQAGTMKTTKGNPDTYFMSKNGKYVFVAYTTQKDNLFEKAKEDIEKCLNPKKTGVQEKDIEEIIFCHTSSNLSAGEDKALKDMCAKKGILFDIYGIDRIADEIYRRYKILAKDHLGMSIDTNQILEQRDFIAKYDSNEMLAPLSTIFQFRKDEYEDMMSFLLQKKVVAVVGKAGVGKTRLSLEVAKDFGNKYGYNVFCIKSMDLSISEDVGSYIDKPGKYLFLIDDANELVGLKYVLEYLTMGNIGYDVKIISTLRDYTAVQVINQIREYTEPNILNVAPFTDEQIKEFLNVNMEIRNEDYVDAIIKIAEGNPRIAYMAGRLAKTEQSLAAINDATQLYESYYAKFLVSSAVTTDMNLCLTASVISLLHTINLTDVKRLDSLLERLNLNQDAFLKLIYRLCEDEFVEIKLDKVATISDQCLRNYMLYYAFCKKKVILYSELLEIGFRSFRNGIVKATGILWNIFSSQEVHDYLTTEIEKVWDIFKEEGGEVFYEYVKYFHDFRPEEVLVIVKDRIDEVETDEVCIDEIDLSKDKYHTEDRIIEMLSGYSNRILLPEAVELMCDYVEKKQSVIEPIMKCIKTNYSIDRNTYKYDYFTVNVIVKAIKRKRKSPIVTKLFMGIACHFLKVLYQPAESGRGNTVTMYTLPITLTEGSKRYRSGIWEELIVLSEEACWEKDISNILEKYAEGWHDEVEKEVFEFDKDYIIQLVDKLWCKNRIRYCVLCKKIKKKWKYYGIESANEFNMIFECEEWKIYNVFSDKRLETELSYEEAEAQRECEIRLYAETLNQEDIENLIDKANQIAYELEREKYEIIHGLGTVVDVLSSDKEKLYHFAKCYVEKGNYIEMGPYILIKNLLLHYGSEYVYNFIWGKEFAQKNRWQFEFFEIFPKEEVNSLWLERLIKFFEDDGDKEIKSSPHRDLRFLDNFVLVEPEIYCIATKIILKKQKYSKFMVQMYLERFFNNHVWKPEELMSKFSTDIELLKKMYFCAIQLDSHTDYKGNFIKYFISIDNSWIQSYAEYTNTKEERSYLYEHDRIVACWDLDNYVEIFDYLLDFIVDKNEYYKWRAKDEFRNILVHEQGKDSRNERKDNWVLQTVERYNDDNKKMIALFESLSELGTNIREKAIAKFVQYNKEYEIFTELSLEPNHWGGTGSMVPCMQGRVKFYESLLPYFTGIDLLKHKQYIQENIRRWKKMIEQQEVKELMESLYY